MCDDENPIQRQLDNHQFTTRECPLPKLPNEDLKMSRPPLPPFTAETAAQKVRIAEDAWNTRVPARVALAYTTDSRWRNRSEFFEGRAAIEAFLTRKWSRLSSPHEIQPRKAGIRRERRCAETRSSASLAAGHYSEADPVARPLPVRADIRAQTATSGGDPKRHRWLVLLRCGCGPVSLCDLD